MEENCVPASLRKILSIRLKEENWQTVRAFCDGTNISYSLETVRRAFNECPYKNLDAITLAAIMKKLNYSDHEIKTILTEHLPKTDKNVMVLSLIGDNKVRDLTIAEESLLELYRTLTNIDPKKSIQVADYLELLASGTKFNAKKLTDTMRR